MQFGTPKTVAEAIAPFKKIQSNLKTVLDAQKAKRTAAEALIAKTRKDGEATIAAAKRKTEQVSKAQGAVIKAQGAVIKAAMNEELQAQQLFDNLQALFDTPKPVDVASMKPADKANAGHALES